MFFQTNARPVGYRILRAALLPMRFLMVATQRSFLRGLWKFLYNLVLSGTCFFIRLSSPHPSIFLRGSFASGEPYYGLSDIDLVVVVDKDFHRAKLQKRVDRVCKAFPVAQDIVELSLLTRKQAKMAVSAPLQSWPPEIAYWRHHDAIRPDGGIRYYGPFREWKRISGPDLDVQDEDGRAIWWIWAWQELQFFWKHWFRNCASLDKTHVPRFCVKQVKTLCRLWVWIEGGDFLSDHAGLIRDISRLLPQEEVLLRRMILLEDSLLFNVDPVIEDVNVFLFRLTRRITQRISDTARATGTTLVKLTGDLPRDLVLTPEAQDFVRFMSETASGVGALPLLDWRALALPGETGARVVVCPAKLPDTAKLGTLARLAQPKLYPGIQGDGFLILPTAIRQWGDLISEASLRSVACQPSDPITFALLRGATWAGFSNLPGWSAESTAKRAVIEHRSWLLHNEANEGLDSHRLNTLWSAVRAALFLETLAEDAPEVPVTVQSLAEAFVERYPKFRDVARAAADSYADSQKRGEEPDGKSVSDFRRAVILMPAYRAAE